MQEERAIKILIEMLHETDIQQKDSLSRSMRAMAEGDPSAEFTRGLDPLASKYSAWREGQPTAVPSYVSSVFSGLQQAVKQDNIEDEIPAAPEDSPDPTAGLNDVFEAIKAKPIKELEAEYPNLAELYRNAQSYCAQFILTPDLELREFIIEAIGGRKIYDTVKRNLGKNEMAKILIKAMFLLVSPVDELKALYPEERDLRKLMYVQYIMSRIGNKLVVDLERVKAHLISPEVNTQARKEVEQKAMIYAKDLPIININRDIKILKSQLKYKSDQRGTLGYKLLEDTLIQLMLVRDDLASEGAVTHELVIEHKQIKRLYEAKRKLVTVHDAFKEMKAQVKEKKDSLDSRKVLGNLGKEDLQKYTQLNSIEKNLEQALAKIEAVLDSATQEDLEATEREANEVIKMAEGIERDVKGQAAKHRGIFTTIADMFKQLWAALKGERPGSLSTLGIVKSVAKGMTQLAKHSGFWTPAEARKGGDRVKMQEEPDEDAEGKDPKP